MNYSTKSQLSPWGNSIGLRIPKEFLEKLGLTKNSEVDIVIKDEEIVIKKTKDNTKDILNYFQNISAGLDLEYMMAKVNDNNIPDREELEDDLVGNEI